MKLNSILLLTIFATGLQPAYSSGAEHQENIQVHPKIKKPSVLTTLFFASAAISGATAISPPLRNSGLKTVNILLVDGGTSGGVCQLVFLSKLEKFMNKPTSKIFDMVGGSSSGCLLTAVLTQPKDPSQAYWEPLFTAEEYLGKKKTEAPIIFSKFRLFVFVHTEEFLNRHNQICVKDQ